MSDEKNLKNDQVRAELARQVLNNPLYQEAFTMIRARIFEAFSQTNFKQSAERDEAWRKIQTVNNIEQWFEDVIERGEFAKLTLLERAKNLL